MPHAARSLVALAVAAPSLALPAPAQTTWHVDVAATPPGDGSAGAPYASIQHAIDQAATVDGDTLLVAPGTYVETIDYGTKAVTVRSTGGAAVTAIEPALATDTAVVTIRAGWIEGFTVRRDAVVTGRHGIFVPEFQNVAFVTGCVLLRHDVGIANTYDAIVERCTITACRYGISDFGSGHHLVESSIVYGNSQADISVGAFGGHTVSWSDVGSYHFSPGCYTPCNNVDLDPQFWDAAGGDVHLRPGSPCIDLGHPAGTDPDGSRADMGALPYDPTWAPGTQGFCFGNATDCPCGNGGSGDGGCDLPQGTGGVVLSASDFDPDSAGGSSVSLVGTGYPPAAAPGVTLIRSPSAATPPVVFGDGLRCIATSGLVRLGAVLASGGTSVHTIGHGAGAGTFRYQLWTRSTPSTFCDANAAFNLSNGLEIVWP